MKRPKFMANWTRWHIIIPLIIILVISGVLGGLGIRTIQSGYKGVTLSWGSITGTAEEGFHWVAWFAGQDIALVNVQIQVFNSDNESTGTVDMQEATTTITVNYRVDPAFIIEVYRDMRDEYEGRVIRGQVRDALKATTAQFSSTQLLKERPAVKLALFSLLTERLSPYHINVLDVALTDFQFSDTFNAQLEATVTAQKKIEEERAQLEIITLQEQQKVIAALAAKNVTLTNAEADALAAKIKADMDAYVIQITANATAESIRMISEQIALNPEYLEYLSILTWNGELPVYWGSDGPIPFLPITNSTG